MPVLDGHEATRRIKAQPELRNIPIIVITSYAMSGDDAKAKAAAKAAAKQASELSLDPDACGPGLRDWLKGIGGGPAPAAAFDTRFNGVPAFTGHASRGIGRLLKRHGYRLIAAPESFLVGQQNTLLDGEASRARRWGAALGVIATSTNLPASA